MTIIRLKHYKKLSYGGSGKNSLIPLPAAIVAMAKTSTVVTFRPLETSQRSTVLKNMHAGKRLDKLPDTDLVFYSVESDSPLAPLLLWDAVHFMSVGRSITLAGDYVKECYLLRTYFQGSLTVEKHDAHAVVFRKVAPLPAEKDASKNAWTFCIPVGPEDATLLNVVVKRILEIDLPQKEILLCGRPGENFQYWDQVRIVGEDITAPPVRICAKKNRLAQEASFENLCILHDRVFLPKQFHKAVEKFGEFYPLTTFQSLYFDDRFNFVPRRYSDFGTSPKIGAMSALGIMRNNDVAASSPFSPSVLALTDKVGFFSGNPLRYAPSNYPTGSLCLVKRSVWLTCPQDENLVWTEFEDLDQARRAETMGIPSRINPHAITQSLIARPLLTTHGAVFYESRNGALEQYRAAFEAFPIPRKPLIKLLHSQMQDNLARFSNKYVPDAVATPLPSGGALNTTMRLRALVQTTHRMKVPLQRKALMTMLGDYEKMLVMDQLPYAWREDLMMQFLAHGNGAVRKFVGQSDQLVNHASQRPRKAVFAKTLLDYLPNAGVMLYVGSFISAILLSMRNRKILYFPGGFLGCYRSIIETTPFSHYAEEKK
jgi:hypothetical protein